MWAGPGGMGEQGRWGGAWRRLGLSGESEPAPTMTLPFTLLESRVDFRGHVAQWLVCPLAGAPPDPLPAAGSLCGLANHYMGSPRL